MGSNVDPTIFIWIGVAMIAVVVGAGIIVAVRRWMRRDVETAESFTFQDLRDMRARGEINEQEYKSMRAALLAEWNIDEGAAAESASPQERGGGPGDEDDGADAGPEGGIERE